MDDAQALRDASRDGNLAEVERILSMPDGKAPDPDEKDKLGRTAMHLAAWAGHSAVIRRLAESGANVCSTAADDVTSAHFASQKGHSEALQALIEANADLTAHDRKKKNTPLHVACEKGFVDAIKVLAAAGASLKATNKGGKTPWDLCPSDDARMALPGGFSKIKGEKANWKEKDPEGFKQAQEEAAVKKAEKAASKPAPAPKVSLASPRSDEGEDDQEEVESAFDVPAAKPKAKRDKPTQDDPYGDGLGPAKRPKVTEESPPAIGPQIRPSIAPQIGPEAGPSPGRGGETGGDAVVAMEQSRADVLEMLEDDPDSQDLKAMLEQIDVTIATLKAARGRA